jgi:hypothetical protein
MINITREQFFEFIKTEKDKDCAISKPTQHYLDYFDKYQSTGKKGGWNWSSFITSCTTLFFFPIAGLLGSYWFFYRRMQFYGILFLALKLAIYLLLLYKSAIYFPGDFHAHFIATTAVGALNILTSIYSNYIYLYYSSKKISKGLVSSGVSKTAIANWSAFIIFKSLSSLVSR